MSIKKTSDCFAIADKINQSFDKYFCQLREPAPEVSFGLPFFGGLKLLEKTISFIEVTL
ncbi:MAG: hypothetical protein KME64_40525 [Scytonematopsis contorta HA4267-MV1]|jgi:hypothetical protein|nr:hypothetical protein [Scytonematopsis contorta HA4267-MV1]